MYDLRLSLYPKRLTLDAGSRQGAGDAESATRRGRAGEDRRSAAGRVAERAGVRSGQSEVVGADGAAAVVDAAAHGAAAGGKRPGDDANASGPDVGGASAASLAGVSAVDRARRARRTCSKSNIRATSSRRWGSA